MKELTKYLMPFIKILLVPYLVLMFLLLYRLDNYYINAPGGITNVDTLIDINYDVDDIEGSFSSTYVISFRKPTVFQFVISDFSNYNNVHILPTSLVHLTDSEVRTISYLQKDESVSNAIISAYKLASESNSEVVFDAGYEEVYKVDMKDSDLSVYDQINLGDIFVSFEGETQLIHDYNDNNISNDMLDDETYMFTFLNPDKGEYSVDLTKMDFNEYMDIDFYPSVNQDLIYPKYSVIDSNIGGPSGGLLQSLHIYNMLVEEDITQGLTIAGTGQISLEGDVGSIGAVRQKIITAYLNQVDMYFVPDINSRNYREALTACLEFGIDPEGWLVPVSTLAEAVSYLEGLEPND